MYVLAELLIRKMAAGLSDFCFLRTLSAHSLLAASLWQHPLTVLLQLRAAAVNTTNLLGETPLILAARASADAKKAFRMSALSCISSRRDSKWTSWGGGVGLAGSRKGH